MKKYILTGEEMRLADEFTIETLGVPSLLLMERAGENIAIAAKKYPQSEEGILCVCGGGNNGGDGFTAARILLKEGLEVAVMSIAEKLTPDCRKKKEEYLNAGGTVFSSIEELSEKKYGLIIDALSGTGFKGKPSETLSEIIRYINDSDSFVMAADIPSGINGDTGEKAGEAVKADQTICIGEMKTGNLLGEGRDYSGNLVRADIGIALPQDGENYAFLSDREEVAALIHKRRRNTNKGDYGKVGIVGGSIKYTGAPFLAAKGAIKSGAGYTMLFLPKKILPYYILKLPEALLCEICPGEKITFREEYFKRLLSCTSIAYGMGAEVSEETYQGIKYLLQNYTGKLVLDADALTSLARYGKAEEEKLLTEKKCEVVMTPHLKEFERLSGKSMAAILSSGYAAAKEYAKKYKITLLLKGATTLITDGEKVAVNISGTPAQAKGGSGDVLSGVIAGVLSSFSLNGFDGARAGAYLSGKAAEIAVQSTGETSLTALEEAERLGSAFLSLTKPENTDEYGAK